MRKLTHSEQDNLSFAVVSLLFALIFVALQSMAVDTNPEDLEYIGTLSLGIIGMTISFGLFGYKFVRSFLNF
jgi:hypothetical protein